MFVSIQLTSNIKFLRDQASQPSKNPDSQVKQVWSMWFPLLLNFHWYIAMTNCCNSPKQQSFHMLLYMYLTFCVCFVVVRPQMKGAKAQYILTKFIYRCVKSNLHKIHSCQYFVTNTHTSIRPWKLQQGKKREFCYPTQRWFCFITLDESARSNPVTTYIPSYALLRFKPQPDGLHSALYAFTLVSGGTQAKNHPYRLVWYCESLQMYTMCHIASSC